MQSICVAYQVQNYQVSGPHRLEEDGYNIDAAVPARVTRAQFLLMSQNLLASRFHMSGETTTTRDQRAGPAGRQPVRFSSADDPLGTDSIVRPGCGGQIRFRERPRHRRTAIFSDQSPLQTWP
jgi:hypothetical protein